MKVKYITIEREYGSGGTEIARRLSAETGISCYGREILEAVSAEQNIPITQIDRYEESITNSFMYSVYLMAQASSGNSDLLSKEGHVFVAEQMAIQKLARAGKAIFIGHCASEALKQEDGVVSVWIRCTDQTAKRNRIVTDYGIVESEAEKTRKNFDKKRANYYYANTARRWDDVRNYDMILDSGTIGMDGCVAVLKALIDQNG